MSQCNDIKSGIRIPSFISQYLYNFSYFNILLLAIEYPHLAYSIKFPVHCNEKLSVVAGYTTILKLLPSSRSFTKYGKILQILGMRVLHVLTEEAWRWIDKSQMHVLHIKDSLPQNSHDVILIALLNLWAHINSYIMCILLMFVLP